VPVTVGSCLDSCGDVCRGLSPPGLAGGVGLEMDDGVEMVVVDVEKKERKHHHHDVPLNWRAKLFMMFEEPDFK
jgi:hypothetical protein